MDIQDFVFIKDKYVFSRERHIRKVRKNISKERVRLLINELRRYNISLIKLSKKEVNQKEKNLILNVALYIYEDEKLLGLIKKNKNIPFNKLSRETNINMDFLIKWREYILAYVILASDDKYIDIYDYLDVNFKELENNNGRRVYVDIDIYRGVVLDTCKKYTIILTSSGEFVRINRGNEIIGSDICGRKKLGFKPYKKLTTVIILICLIIGSLGYYYYEKEKSTIVIQGTSQIKLSLNNFDKVTYGYSATEKGKLLLSEIKWENKGVKTALDNIFLKLQELNMIPADRKLEIIITGEELKDSIIENILEYVENVNSDEDKENNVKITINNVGNEKVLK
ncbi:MAG: hypothetical protein Q4B63_03905 [Clostridium perfringens]|nr:hypothetical protein [Clostridium perfringens]